MSCKDILEIVVPSAATVIAVYLAYRYAILQMQRESKEHIQQKKYEAILEAHKELFGLLAFMTMTENPRSIIVWERSEDNSNLYYLRRSNAQGLLTALPTAFYGGGHGLFLDTEVTNLIFEYRSIIYGVLAASKDQSKDLIPLENKKMVERMKKIYEELNSACREALRVERRNLNFGDTA